MSERSETEEGHDHSDLVDNVPISHKSHYFFPEISGSAKNKPRKGIVFFIFPISQGSINTLIKDLVHSRGLLFMTTVNH